MSAPNYFNWLRSRRFATATDAAPDWKADDHPRTGKGGKGGGQFRTKPETIEREDELDPVAKIERDATPAEKAAVAKGSEPDGGRFEPVTPDELPTMKQTNSKYRRLRNAANEAINRMKAAGGTDLDGTYPIDNPEKKVTHIGPDGQEHPGFADGYSVSFQTTNGEGYNRDRKDLMMSDEEYDATVEKLAAETGSPVYVGVFGGIPEVSFRCDTLEQAMDIARRYNQVSIANNARIAADEWDAPDIFPQNDAYDWRENQTWKMK